MFYRKKRGKKDIWHVYWREDGKQRSKAVSTDLQVVKKFELMLANRLDAKKNGMLINNISFDELCDEYIESYSKSNKRKRSIIRDEITLKTFKKNCPEIRFVKQFNGVTLNNFKILRKKQVSEATINRELGTLKNMMKYAYEMRYLERDYSSQVSYYKSTKEAKNFILEEKDIDKLMENTEHPYKTAFMLGLYTGLRRGEVCHLEWDDIDFDNNILYVKDKKHLKLSPKNNSSIRSVPIHSHLKKYLLIVKKLAKKKTNFVCFFLDNYRDLNEDVLTGMVRKFRIKLELPQGFCFHCLRHTFVSKMSEMGVPVYHISKIVGHSSTKMTEQVYTHLKDTTFFKSIEKINY
ncbi:MAG: site-specific integrase [bacterium]|nr:site-specific integrase [bacterium]